MNRAIQSRCCARAVWMNRSYRQESRGKPVNTELSVRFRIVTSVAFLVSGLIPAADSIAQDVPNPASIRPAEEEYSPYLNHNHPDCLRPLGHLSA